MAIFDIFSKRQKRLKEGAPDVYTYDDFTDKLRSQIIHIINDSIGIDKNYDRKPEIAYQTIHGILCREYGVFNLAEGSEQSHKNEIFSFFLSQKNVNHLIDVVEVSFRYISTVIAETFHQYKYTTEVELSPEEAVSDLNTRFKENAVGYSFIGGEVIRVDSTYMHSEVTKPTISLLWNKVFQGASEEYLKAHKHYRSGRNKECLTECLKALESTMKIICAKKKWVYNETDTARKLIQICFQNDLVPTFTQNQFTSLQNLLESGVPTIRNKLGGHGQGQVPQKVDDEMTRYALNLCGTNIIFLIEQSGIK